jgi:hypothetical protein
VPLVPSSSVAAVFTKSTGSWRDHCATVLGLSSGDENSTASTIARSAITPIAMHASLTRSYGW